MAHKLLKDRDHDDRIFQYGSKKFFASLPAITHKLVNPEAVHASRGFRGYPFLP